MSGQKVGYIRVSSLSQNLDRQTRWNGIRQGFQGSSKQQAQNFTVYVRWGGLFCIIQLSMNQVSYKAQTLQFLYKECKV